MSTPRLEELRTSLRAESISWGELYELQTLADQIDPGDVELLEAAGLPEFPDDLLPDPCEYGKWEDRPDFCPDLATTSDDEINTYRESACLDAQGAFEEQN